MTRRFDNVAALCGPDVKTILDGPKEKILETWKRQAMIFAQYPAQGYRTKHALGFDPTTSLENMEYIAKAYLETFKLPFQVYTASRNFPFSFLARAWNRKIRSARAFISYSLSRLYLMSFFCPIPKLLG